MFNNFIYGFTRSSFSLLFSLFYTIHFCLIIRKFLKNSGCLSPTKSVLVWIIFITCQKGCIPSEYHKSNSNPWQWSRRSVEIVNFSICLSQGLLGMETLYLIPLSKLVRSSVLWETQGCKAVQCTVYTLQQCFSIWFPQREVLGSPGLEVNKIKNRKTKIVVNSITPQKICHVKKKILNLESK